MNLRKIFGYFLLFFSIYLIPCAIIAANNTFADLPKDDGAERLGYITGCIIFYTFLSWLIYFMIKKSLKIIKSKPENVIDKIEQS